MSSVDIVVPCYNYARYLEFCVYSVLQQRDVDVRVLIIDDASPDNAAQVGGGLAAADSRVHYVRNEINLGLIGTANRGVMDWACADYVLLLSADDALTPGSLARATKLMDTTPDVVLTYGMAFIIQDDGPDLRVEDALDAPSCVLSGKSFIRRVCEHGNVIPTPCAVMRTSVQHQIGGYNPLFKHTSDLDMWMRAAAVGSIGVINAIQGLYRWHGSNMSSAYQSRATGDRAEVRATCKSFYERHGKDFPEFSYWFKQMERRFGNECIQIAMTSFESGDAETWRDALAFGKRLRRDYWRSLAWQKFLIKRNMSPTLVALIKRAKQACDARLEPKIPTERAGAYHGLKSGWWPEETSGA
jgi:glycosyltransferase involved in cell wall biosynthesis